ncbi:MAG: Gfo/Idh/MocA family oxidoreductase [PVC group bacterium]
MIKLGIIGVGGWGKNLLRNFQEQPGAEVVTAADLVESRLAAARAKYPEMAVTADYGRILQDSSIRAVVVATPGSTHYRIARDCLEAGKDVFVEKPMALTADECRKLCEQAEKRELILMVGHLLLYHPGVIKLKDELRSGKIGDLYYLYSQRVNLGKIRRSENALWTFAPHDVSVALYLIDREPRSVAARGESYIQSNVADVDFITITFPDRVMAHLHVSWLDPHKIRRVTIVGSRKMMVFDDMDSSEPIRIYDKGVPENLVYDTYGEYLNLRYGDVQIPWVKAGEPLQAETGHFIRCVKERRRPLTDGENGCAVVRVLEAAQRSLEEGGVTVEL